MALKTYRYRNQTPAEIVADLPPLVDWGPMVPAPTLVASVVGRYTIDVSYDDAHKDDLDGAMLQLGWIFELVVP